MADSCIFCRIERAEIPAQMLVNNKDIVAFRDANPQAPVHILVVPKKHIASLDDAADSDLLGRMISLAAA
jgi:histidine triad (HIT) family protein